VIFLFFHVEAALIKAQPGGQTRIARRRGSPVPVPRTVPQ
jgi:hypothetical protein